MGHDVLGAPKNSVLLPAGSSFSLRGLPALGESWARSWAKNFAQLSPRFHVFSDGVRAGALSDIHFGNAK